MYWLNNKFNIIAIIVGVLSIFTILINQSLEREYVQMSPKLEQIVHEKVSSLKKSVVDAIKGKTYQAASIDIEAEQRQKLLNRMKQIKQIGLVLSVLGIIFTAISFIRHENKYSCRIALALNGSILSISLLMYVATSIASIVTILLLIWLLGNIFGFC